MSAAARRVLALACCAGLLSPAAAQEKKPAADPLREMAEADRAFLGRVTEGSAAKAAELKAAIDKALKESAEIEPTNLAAAVRLVEWCADALFADHTLPAEERRDLVRAVALRARELRVARFRPGEAFRLASDYLLGLRGPGLPRTVQPVSALFADGFQAVGELQSFHVGKVTLNLVGAPRTYAVADVPLMQVAGGFYVYDSSRECHAFVTNSQYLQILRNPSPGSAPVVPGTALYPPSAGYRPPPPLAEANSLLEAAGANAFGFLFFRGAAQPDQPEARVPRLSSATFDRLRDDTIEAALKRLAPGQENIAYRAYARCLGLCADRDRQPGAVLRPFPTPAVRAEVVPVVTGENPSLGARAEPVVDLALRSWLELRRR